MSLRPLQGLRKTRLLPRYLRSNTFSLSSQTASVGFLPVHALTDKSVMQDCTWNFIATGENTGEFNMRYDEMLVRRLIDGIGMPTVRLYRWKPWAISLGHNQNLCDIDVPRSREDGISIVRRPTGGRAILHAEELTYSVVMSADHKGIRQAYNEIGGALVEGLKKFGVHVSLTCSQRN